MKILLKFGLFLPMFLLIIGCDSDPLSRVPPEERQKVRAKLDNLIMRTEQDMILIEGGEFYFRYVDSVRWGKESDIIGGGIPVGRNSVQLDSYLLSRFQIILKDYLLFRKINGWQGTNYTEKEKQSIDKDIQRDIYGKWEVVEQYDIPVRLPWQEAQRYCEWLGQVVTNKKGSLPTAAQWEYAAGNRGSGAVFATDNDRYQIAYNVPSPNDTEKFSYLAVGTTSIVKVMPVGWYPSSPLGLYDMGSNGNEWVYDWYDPDYYKQLPKGLVNPQGQTREISYQKYHEDDVAYKEVRSKNRSNVSFSLIQIDSGSYDSYKYDDRVFFSKNTARCVMNQSDIIKQED